MLNVKANLGLASTSELSVRYCEQLWEACFAPRPFVAAEIRDFLDEFENQRVDYDRRELYEALCAVRDALAVSPQHTSTNEQQQTDSPPEQQPPTDDSPVKDIQLLTARVLALNSTLKACMHTKPNVDVSEDSTSTTLDAEPTLDSNQSAEASPPPEEPNA